MMTKTMTNPTKKDMNRAEEVMRTYQQLVKNKLSFMAKHKNEVDSYDRNIREAVAELLEIGERNKAAFDAKGNLEFEAGYLHIAQSTVIVKGKKFNEAVFASEFPDFMDVKLKTALIKKAYTNKEQRAELEAAGIKLDTEEVMEVKLSKVKLG